MVCGGTGSGLRREKRGRFAREGYRSIVFTSPLPVRARSINQQKPDCQCPGSCGFLWKTGMCPKGYAKQKQNAPAPGKNRREPKNLPLKPFWCTLAREAGGRRSYNYTTLARSPAEPASNNQQQEKKRRSETPKAVLAFSSTFLLCSRLKQTAERIERLSNNYPVYYEPSLLSDHPYHSIRLRSRNFHGNLQSPLAKTRKPVQKPREGSWA